MLPTNFKHVNSLLWMTRTGGSNTLQRERPERANSTTYLAIAMKCGCGTLPDRFRSMLRCRRSALSDAFQTNDVAINESTLHDTSPTTETILAIAKDAHCIDKAML